MRSKIITPPAYISSWVLPSSYQWTPKDYKKVHEVVIVSDNTMETDPTETNLLLSGNNGLAHGEMTIWNLAKWVYNIVASSTVPKSKSLNQNLKYSATILEINSCWRFLEINSKLISLTLSMHLPARSHLSWDFTARLLLEQNCF